MTHRVTDRLFTFFADPRAVPRDIDLLPPDAPVKTYAAPAPRANPGLRALVFVVAMAVAVLLGGAVIVAVQGHPTISAIQSSGLELFGAVVGYVVLTGPMEDRLWPFELAWRRWPALLRGLLLGFVALSVTIGVVALSGGYRITGLNPAYSPWPDLFTLGLVAGVAEEIIFRGVLFRLVEDGLGTWGAVAVSALVFGLLHLTNKDATLMGGLAIVVEAGLLFAAVYVVTRNLWWTIGLHVAWNVAEGPVYGSVVSGSSDKARSWIAAEWPGPDWLTGGRFGVEASVVPMVLLGLVSVWLLVRAQKGGYIVAPWWVRRRTLRARAV